MTQWRRRLARGETARHHLLPALFALAGVGMILAVTWAYGAGLTWDSVIYLAVARNLVNGVGFVDASGGWFVLQPPLYPLLLAAPAWCFGADPVSLIHFGNAALFGGIVYLSGVLWMKYLPDARWWSGLVAGVVLCSLPLIPVSYRACTEPLFIFLMLLFLLGAESYRERQRGRTLVFMALITAVACLTRYVGVVMAGVGMLVIAFNGDYERMRKKLCHLVVFGLISTLPLALWALRNYLLTESLFGPRNPSTASFGTNVALWYDTIVLWYLPGAVTRHGLIVSLTLATGLFGGIVYVVRSWNSARSRLATLTPVILMTAMYSALLLYTASTAAFDTLDDRLLSPLFVPVTLLLYACLYGLFSIISRRLRRAGRIALMTIAALILLIFPYRAYLLITVYKPYEGVGYMEKEWKTSAIVHHLKNSPPLGSACAVYSNDLGAVYLFGNSYAKTSPTHPEQASVVQKADALMKLRDVWPREDSACLVWFNRTKLPNRLTVDELRSVVDLEPMVTLSDGAVYRIRRR